MSAKNTFPFIEPYLLLSNSDGCFRVPLQQIVYCSSYNSSTVFNIIGKRSLVIAKPISYYEKILQHHGFIRIHHSTLVNIAYLCHTSKGDDTNELTLTTGEKLNVSRLKKLSALKAVQRFSIDPILEQAHLPVNPQNIPVNPKNLQDSHKPKTKNKN